jgi:hypothetical protein
MIIALLNDNRPIVRNCCDRNGTCPGSTVLKPLEANLVTNFDYFNVVKERPCEDMYDPEEDENVTLSAISKVSFRFTCDLKIFRVIIIFRVGLLPFLMMKSIIRKSFVCTSMNHTQKPFSVSVSCQPKFNTSNYCVNIDFLYLDKSSTVKSDFDNRPIILQFWICKFAKISSNQFIIVFFFVQLILSLFHVC